MMATHYSRTEQGRSEIKTRTVAMSRQARNLLLIIDAGASGDEWVARVNGCTDDDLRQLIANGLIAEAMTSAAPALALNQPQVTLDEALQACGYQTLYDLLTAQARPRLGLIKGYRMILEIERCVDVAALRALVPRFIDEVRDKQGDTAAQALRHDLGARP